jgi:hypothetical protein
MSTRLVEAVDRRKIPSYRSRDVQLRLADRNGTRKVMNMSCEAVDMTVYDLILGMDWAQIGESGHRRGDRQVVIQR